MSSVARPAAGAGAIPTTMPASGAGHDVAWWGLMGLLLTEGALFAYLLASYFYLNTTHTTWPPAGAPSLRIALPNTVLLVASSGTVWWADRAARGGRRGALLAGLLVTFLFGATFVAFQTVEYRGLEFRPQTDAYGSMFWTITGLHVAHVVAGLLIIAYTMLRTLAGHFDRPGEHPAVRTASYYWHFVDVVWLVVFTSLYLTPRLW